MDFDIRFFFIKKKLQNYDGWETISKQSIIPLKRE